MDLGLTGRRALVTGGSRGIGLACARRLAAEGANVAIVARDRDRIDQALTQIPGGFGACADLADAAAAVSVLDIVETEFGPLDILVNSAGAAQRTVPDELTPAHWRAAMDAKYFTYINVIDPLIKRMAARGSGVIVNVVGSGGKTASPTHLPGGAANAALMLATVGLGTAYAARGVRVVGVNPGQTSTERVQDGLQADARLAGQSVVEAMASLVAAIPAGRLGSPEEIADVVAFLASDRASYVTAVNLSMEGGRNPIVV